MLELEQILMTAIDNKASDIHLTVGAPPIVRVSGRLLHVGEHLLTPEETLQAKLPCCKKKACAEGEEPEKTDDGEGDAAADEEEADEEFFTEEESAEMEERMRHALGGDRDGETATAPSAKREIPRDEEASEADFQ